MARLLVARVPVQPYLLRTVLPDQAHEPAVHPRLTDPVEVGVELFLDSRREISSEIPSDAVLWPESQGAGRRGIHEQQIAVHVMNTHEPQAALDETVIEADQPIAWRAFGHQREGNPVRGEIVTRVSPPKTIRTAWTPATCIRTCGPNRQAVGFAPWNGPAGAETSPSSVVQRSVPPVVSLVKLVTPSHVPLLHVSVVAWVPFAS